MKRRRLNMLEIHMRAAHAAARRFSICEIQREHSVPMLARMIGVALDEMPAKHCRRFASRIAALAHDVIAAHAASKSTRKAERPSSSTRTRSRSDV